MKKKFFLLRTQNNVAVVFLRITQLLLRCAHSFRCYYSVATKATARTKPTCRIIHEASTSISTLCSFSTPNNKLQTLWISKMYSFDLHLCIIFSKKKKKWKQVFLKEIRM